MMIANAAPCDNMNQNGARRTSIGILPTNDLHQKRIETDIQQLLLDIRRVKPQGESYCLFGDLFVDAAVEQYYEALVGTLKAAKKKGFIHFDGQVLFKGMHDKVRVSIVTTTATSKNLMDSSTNDRCNTATTSSVCTEDITDNVATSNRKMSDLSTCQRTIQCIDQIMLTPVKKDSSTQTSTSSTKIAILTPTQERACTWNKNSRKSSSSVLSVTKECSENVPVVESQTMSKDRLALKLKPVRKEELQRSYLSKPMQSSVNALKPVCNSHVQMRISDSLVPVGEKTHESSSVVRGAETHTQRVDREIHQLLLDIKRIEPKEELFCSFGDLFVDEHVEQYYEALVGTLKAAKKKGLVQFQGQMLFKGLHDHVRISIIE